MSTESTTIVQRLWNYCNVLRDDGVGYGDYVEQLTYLLFLKMADEQIRPPFNKPSRIPKKFDWPSLVSKDGDELETHYRRLLEELGREKGLLGVIFRKGQNKVQDPAKLRRLIELINGETWVGLDIDVKGDIYEGLLQKNAEDTKSGAGQYFTPRPLTKAMVAVTRPQPGMSEKPWTDRLWIYDLRTNQHFTLKTNPLTFDDLQDFIRCYNPDNRHKRTETDRFRSFPYVDLVKRNKCSLDIFWLKDENLEDGDALPEPDVLAAEITASLGTALDMFEGIEETLGR